MYSETIEGAGLRGVLQTPPDGSWSLDRLAPIKELESYVSWVWVAAWDMEDGCVHQQTTLPYPTANLVVEDKELCLYGPTTTRFEKTLKGRGLAVGIKFKPGGVKVLVNEPVAEIVNKLILADKLFCDSNDLMQVVESGSLDVAKVSRDLQILVASKLPDKADPNLGLVSLAFDEIRRDSQLTKVDELAGRLNVARRSLQRLFHNYVGLGVKATIKRYRLQEAAEVALSGNSIDWARLASRLGYYDQSHLIAEFRNTFGVPPGGLKT